MSLPAPATHPPTPMAGSSRRWAAFALLLTLPLMLLWRLLGTNRILVGLDVFNFFYPYHDFAAASLGAGRFPLWNPHLFLGVPFLADSQSQLLYPLAWPLLLVSAPRALALSLAMHLVIGAAGAFFWGRRALGVGWGGAWVLAALFVLGGYLGSQAEHPNQLAAAAWLPWLLLGADVARSRYQAGLLLGSAALALSLLAGHAQTTFLSLGALALWALVAVGEMLWVERRAGLARLWRPVVTWLLFGVLGGMLAAAQLVPQLELSALSIRAEGLPLREAVSFSWDPRLWPRALLPTFGHDERVLSEYVAYLGFSGALLALLGLLFGTRRRAWWVGVMLVGAGLSLAPAIINPLYPLLWRFVPGFDLFRAPARWLLLYALGGAVLAGLGAEWLVAQRGALSRRAWLRLLLGGGLLAGLAAASLLVADLPARAVWPWWVGAGMAAGALLLVIPRLRPGWRWPLLALVVVGELLLASGQLDFNKPTAPEAYLALRPTPAHLLTQQPPAGQPRLLSMSDLTWDPGDLSELQGRHADVLGEEAIYDLVVATKLKEVLAPNQPMRWGLSSADGYGGGVLPLATYTELQSLLPLTKIVPDGRLRERLTGVPSRPLLDLLGVMWIVADKVDDLWVEGVYHQLTVPVAVESGRPLRWERPSPVPVTAVSLIARGPLPTSLQARLVVESGTEQFELPLTPSAFAPVRETAQGAEARAMLTLTTPITITGLRLEGELGSPTWTLAGLTLVDARLPAFAPLPADPAFETTLSGDVVVLRRREALGRAWAVPTAQLVSRAEVTPTMAAPTWEPRREVLLLADEGPIESEGRPALTEAEVRWVSEKPERLAWTVRTDGEGWLVVADNWYPGWEAEVNGVPVGIRRANGFARALPLPGPGEHSVVMRYRPRSVLLGATITLAALVLWSGVALWGWRRGW